MIGPRKTPTIQDVARQAKVSAATVSRVLSSPERVREATRERVQNAVRDSGYTINQAARSLRMRSARTILMAAPDIGNPFYSTIVDAVISEASSRGYSVLVASHIGDNPNRWLHDYLLSNRSDGLLLFDSGLDTGRLHDLSADGATVPLVAAYDEIPDAAVHSVITDNRHAAKRAVQHLIELGHRRIGHVLGLFRKGYDNERHIGYVAAMQEAGLPIRDDWVVPGNFNIDSGVAAAEHYLSLSERPTAVFAANDEMALGLIYRLKRGGLACPADMSVVGFDDVTMSAFCDPPLTTMRQPRVEIGRVATRSLIDVIEGVIPADKPVHIVLPSHLVVRESTAPPR